MNEMLSCPCLTEIIAWKGLTILPSKNLEKVAECKQNMSDEDMFSIF